MTELTFKINDFEGPLDLLLHLISKHKMQLFDIQIYQLIDQYLDFIGKVGPEQLEPTSEFVEMAARLVYLKSVALLPRSEEKEELEHELVGQLVEYALCKQAASRLRDRSEGINFFVREPMKIDLPNVYDRKHEPKKLLEAILAVQGRNRQVPNIEQFEPLVTALGSLRIRNGRPINEFFLNTTGRSETVATFLGLLELIRNGRIMVDDDGIVHAKEQIEGEINS